MIYPSLYPCYNPLLQPLPLSSSSSSSSSSSNPPTLHCHLSPPATHLYCIGDVHGCYDELMQMLSKIKELEKSAGDEYLKRVVLVGDLVNKGPSSPSVLSYARKNRIMSVSGNHDVSAYRVARGLKVVKDHQRGKYGWIEEISKEDVEYLGSMPSSITVNVGGKDYVIVHAGLIEGKSLEEHTLEELTTIRLISPNPSSGYTPTLSPGDGAPWASVYTGGHGTVIFGHDARRGLQREEHAVGIDTGCVYGRELTA
eukprot:CAMPEP_0118637652 /NCGR_PEP_ID=MMETSP0785-20121206/3264_1 /TAXON_ID=91992 /ORGANISM="Bolidomonas pacifica, Strain CCMP 1866" /LENGTH=254 /DNA_ID=CAMNT_0006528847 /DNA_START=112 /DNA_END=873 /DNA_ORIENTATION=+